MNPAKVFLQSLLLAMCLAETARGQSPGSSSGPGAGPGAGSPAQFAGSNANVLSKIDELVTQNSHLVEQNQELIQEIRVLREALAERTPAEKGTTTGALIAPSTPAASVPSEHKIDSTAAATNTDKKKWGTYTQNLGFNVAETPYGDLNLKLFTYVRYLNQRELNPAYTNYFGTTSTVQQRQDIQVNKMLFYFLGWFMSPKFRYLGYVWSTNASQGQGAQVVVAGNLQYAFDRHFTLGAGISSLPGTRSLEGNFPYWLGVDDRTIGDEFFRPSYTTGIWGTGEIARGLTYNVMLGNNMSQLGVSAAQLNNGLNTLSTAVVWMPTTKEFGPNGGYGDFEHHDKLATRFGFHFNRSDENKQSQPNTDSFDNVQIRLTDGTVIFTPNLFGAGTSVSDVRYHMIDLDAGLKYRGFSMDGEYYHRWLNGFQGPGTSGLAQINDNGFQVLTSAMLRPKLFQLYAGGSTVFGKYGTPWDARVGITYFPWRNRSVRWNAEYIQLHKSPVGASSLPYSVGATGPTVNSNLMVIF